MDNFVPYARLDEHGVMRVADTRVMLDSIVAAFEQGHSPETIRQQYPSLTLEAVYGAITYYLAHPKEVHEYLNRQETVWQQWRAKSEEQRFGSCRSDGSHPADLRSAAKLSSPSIV